MKTSSRKRRAAAALLAMMAVASGGPDAVAQEKAATRWCGYQGATTDVLATGFFVVAVSTFRLCLSFSWESSSTRSSCDNSTSDAFFVVSLATYGLGGPVSHAANGHWDRAGLSLALRSAPFVIGVPLVSASPSGPGALVMLAGMPIAMVIDDAVLAREDVAPTDAALRVVPAYDPRAHTGALVLSGRL